jgi:cytochrome c553
MSTRFWSRLAVVLITLSVVWVPLVLSGCGAGGGAGAGGGDAGGFNNSPFPGFPGTGQFSNIAGLPNSAPTLAQVERGRYLVTSAGCTDCHSVTGNDPNSAFYLAGFVGNTSVNPNQIGFFPGGGYGLPINSFALNITEDTTGIVFHSPLELFLNFRTGQHHHNAGLLCEPMPWNFFTNMTDSDIWSIVAYLRGNTPVSNNVSYAQNSTGQLLGLQNCNQFPEQVIALPAYPASNEVPVTNTTGPGLPNGPATLDQVLEGRYLVTAVIGCGGCHNRNIDDPNDPLWLSGFVADKTTNPQQVGFFQIGPDQIFAANLTPDVATGLGSFSTQDIFNVLRFGIGLGNTTPLTVFPPMPWPDIRNLTDEDIYSIIAYLQNLKPVSNAVPQDTGPVPAQGFYPPGGPQPFPLPPYPASHEINPEIPPPTP